MKINHAHALTLSLIGLAFVTPAAMAEDGHNHAAAGHAAHGAPAHAPAGHEAHADHMLEGYAVVATALYQDDLAAAQKAAAGMVKHDKHSAMAKHAQAIADSKDIETARMHFKMMSDVAIPIAKKEKTMHQMHCPMAANGKGADWLQKSADEVQNPYMGARMAHCGTLVE
jgi:hypothetical protein